MTSFLEIELSQVAGIVQSEKSSVNIEPSFFEDLQWPTLPGNERFLFRYRRKKDDLVENRSVEP